ncbi:SDR family NAD(P)-dependent oxidoreductase [Paenibacillus hodogayensis]|uniref:SDR family NAD(P)-dependent oxidoreductase n=1 Tax=Paenibacillus hodogayensis TaxID=279208 RepID=A0ABV5VTT0_9BACL
MNVMQLFRLDGKVAVVTGGSGLYGTHISEALCEAGATVLIASRNREQCELKAAELRERGYAAHGVRLDLSDEADIGRFVAEAESGYGGVDVLINNSVSRTGLNDIEQTTAEGWLAAQQVNGLGLMLMSKAAVRSMRERGGGAIVNIGSIQGILGPHFPVYGDTGMSSGIEYTYAKWGMVGMTKWLANYYGKHNIRVNCISPGGYNPVGTDNEIRAESFVSNYIERTPLGRMADDSDIKGAVVYLASDAAKYVTGHNLVVDGGWSAW